MWRKFCLFVLTKVMGWKYIGGPAPEAKAIILGVPHTSMWDFIVSYFFYTGIGGNAKVMIKSSMFFWPLGPILRALGGVPVDRNRATGLVKSMVEQANAADTFHIAMCPEGTRKLVTKWKTGFHYIATQADMAVYLGYFDWKTKTISIGEKFELTNDASADLARIQEIYKGMNLEGRHPKLYCYNQKSDIKK